MSTDKPATPVRRIHHINFIYRNLEHAVAIFERALKLGPFEFDELPERGVRTARVQVGETFLVIVSPANDEGAPARYLEAHGEGFFLLSFEVDDLGKALEQLDHPDAAVLVSQSRRGLDGWHVTDVPIELPGILVQLTDPARK
ncbi:MAG: VOC family protein [Gammaproteobacteria bacterium]